MLSSVEPSKISVNTCDYEAACESAACEVIAVSIFPCGDSYGRNFDLVFAALILAQQRELNKSYPTPNPTI